MPESILNTVALVTPELMTVPLEQGEAGAVALEAIAGEKLGKLMKGIKVLAIGPGLSTEGEAPEFVHAILSRTGADGGNVPAVIDADGLNAFAGKAERLKGYTGIAQGKGVTRTVVLTPHPGEMARLLGTTVKEVEADRAAIARRFATEHGVTLVLKGWRDAGGTSGWPDCGEHDGKPGDGEGRQRRHSDGNRGGDAGPVRSGCGGSG